MTDYTQYLRPAQHDAKCIICNADINTGDDIVAFGSNDIFCSACVKNGKVREHLIRQDIQAMKPLNMTGFSCAGCGADVMLGDNALVCSDCGGVFCETCIRNGTFHNHECDDGEDDED